MFAAIYRLIENFSDYQNPGIRQAIAAHGSSHLHSRQTFGSK
jgi:hypothetical protein